MECLVILPTLYMFIIYDTLCVNVFGYICVLSKSLSLIIHVIISYYTLMYISYDSVRIKLPRTQYRSESTCHETQHTHAWKAGHVHNMMFKFRAQLN